MNIRGPKLISNYVHIVKIYINGSGNEVFFVLRLLSRVSPQARNNHINAGFMPKSVIKLNKYVVLAGVTIRSRIFLLSEPPDRGFGIRFRERRT